ncbi:hypothetical protein QBC39DRAFT_135863 [Podospora conica]|nr:hypothetical protein QBC39DRAFT_135863 [Schizothecium conicum]
MDSCACPACTVPWMRPTRSATPAPSPCSPNVTACRSSAKFAPSLISTLLAVCLSQQQQQRAAWSAAWSAVRVQVSVKMAFIYSSVFFYPLVSVPYRVRSAGCRSSDTASTTAIHERTGRVDGIQNRSVGAQRHCCRLFFLRRTGYGTALGPVGTQYQLTPDPTRPGGAKPGTLGSGREVVVVTAQCPFHSFPPVVLVSGNLGGHTFDFPATDQ